MGYSYFEKYKDDFKLNETFLYLALTVLGGALGKELGIILKQMAKNYSGRLMKKIKNKFNLDGAYDFYNMLKQQNEGKIDSWAVRWLASAYINNLFTLYPISSFVFHSGNDGCGTNYSFKSEDDPLNVPLSTKFIELKR